jgi:hypothetical protein
MRRSSALHQRHSVPPAFCKPQQVQPRIAAGEHAPEAIRLRLHEVDLVTGEEDSLSALFYECYRGYTIYSNALGLCCLHGPLRQGCLRIRGEYVCFSDIEDAKNLIKYFRSQGIMSWEDMERDVPANVYRTLVEA